MSEKKDARQIDARLGPILAGTGTDKPKDTKGDESRSATQQPVKPELGISVGRAPDQPDLGGGNLSSSKPALPSFQLPRVGSPPPPPRPPLSVGAIESKVPVKATASSQSIFSTTQTQGSSCIKEDDLVLAFDFHGELTPPAGFSSWEELPCGSKRVVLLSNRELSERLRNPNIDQDAWRTAKQRLTGVLEEQQHHSATALHLFMNAPHPLALWLGQELERLFRQKKLFIYQFEIRTRRWVLFLTPENDPQNVCRKLNSVEDVGIEVSEGNGSILSIEIVQHATHQQLEALRDRVHAARIQRLRSVAVGTLIDAGPEAKAALELMVDAIAALRSRTQGQPIYIATSAPLALMIGLGRYLPDSVYHQVWACIWDKEQACYVPVLEATRGYVAPASRPRLEIFQKGIGLLYRLNGALLETVGDPRAETREDYRLGDDARLIDDATLDFSRRGFPLEVVERTQSYKSLDIEISLEGESALLPWELLRFPEEHGKWLALETGRTLTRLVPGRQQWRARPLIQEPLKVLIVPSLNPNDPQCSLDEAEHFLKLKTLEANLLALGAYPWRLEYGVGRQELQEAMLKFNPHVLHWVGHGLPDQGKGWPGILEVPDELHGTVKLERTQLPLFLRASRESLRLVVLGSCYAISPRAGYGLPGCLLDEGLDAVIGFRDPVYMGELRWFAEAFYRALVEGFSIRDSVALARVALHKENGRRISFASPLLCVRDPRAAGPLVERRER